jgi:hypothetical protein
MSKTWTERAKELPEEYIPNNQWEAMLGRHLKRCNPALVKELGKELEAYLQVMTWEAMEYEETLLDAGTEPHMARELTMEYLLPKAPEEWDRPEPFETESSLDSQEAAALKALLSNPSESPRAKTIPPT